MSRRPWVWVAALAGIAGCVGLDEDPGLHARTAPPDASLRTPVIAPVGQPVLLDASASVDRAGRALSFVFEVSDGTEPVRSTEPAIQHVFARQGLFTVHVRVVDAAGQEAHAAQDIIVRADYPDHPEFCQKASDCVVGDECDAGVCYSTGGALD